jgi:hypothetical protein
VRGERVAIAEASDAVHRSLRARFDGPEVGYAGQDFRVYGFLRIGKALQYYRAIHPGWDEAQLQDDLACAALSAEFEVRRMKRTYQRALVLALVAATRPQILVVERADEFDEEPTAALLERVLRRAPQAYVTYAPEASIPSDWFDRTLQPDELAASA